MSLPKFEYLAPKTLSEACSMLSQHKGEAMAIAGGTDLVTKLRDRALFPKYLIKIKGLPDLDYIRYSEAEGLKIGALAPNQSVANSPPIREKFRFLAEAVGLIGTVQVRNLGTIGGNLCNAAPSADAAPPLTALGAKGKLVSSRGERVVDLEGFFTGPGATVLEADEILAEIQVPNPPPHSGGAYLKIARTAVDIAVVGVAASITLGGDGSCSDAGIVLGAVAPVPLRARKAEAALKGKKLEGTVIEEGARLAAEESRPISDVRGSAEYRKEMVRVLTGRAINEALERARAS
jgi:CO/xanthine dehydrogenase FAD-binding subunit